jgi:beta-galactosidase GanA
MKFAVCLLLIIFKIALSHSEIPSIGVCYYPEHWKFQKISQDILEMKKLGIKHVRIVKSFL